MKGIATNIQRFCIHDGPGVRTTVFLKGCPLRCRWCHNPETQISRPQPMLDIKKCLYCGACEAVCPQGCHSMTGTRFLSDECDGCLRCASVCPAGAIEVSGKEWEAEKLAGVLSRDEPFFGADGGVTLSGGEPTYQMDFALAVMDGLKKRGINVALETCGAFPQGYLSALLPRVDHFLWDVKDTDPARHKQNTGADLAPILRNLREACAGGADVTVRGIVLRGVNDTLEHARRLGELAREYGAGDCRLFPFHPYYSAKLTSVGRPGEAMDQSFVPEDDTLSAMKQALLAAFRGDETI